MKWVQASELESKIILALGKNKKCQADLARDVKHSPKSVSTTVSRLEDQGIITRSKDYIQDSRKSLIQLDRRKIKIKKTHDFYQKFFSIQLSVIFLSLIISYFTRILTNSILIWISVIVSIIPSILYMAYNVYITKDKITVDKKVMQRGKYKKKDNADTEDTDQE